MLLKGALTTLFSETIECNKGEKVTFSRHQGNTPFTAWRIQGRGHFGQGFAREFEDEWDFRHCLEAIDGEPKNESSTFFNYKNFHNTVLMAACDAKYCFPFVDIGSYGRDNDAAIFSQPELATGLESGNIFCQFIYRTHHWKIWTIYRVNKMSIKSKFSDILYKS